MRSPRKVGQAVLFVAVLLGADLALSVHIGEVPTMEAHGTHGVDLGGAPLARDPPVIPRHEAFPRLGSIALNMTPCLHASGEQLANGFTCESDLYASYAHAHGNGDHFGNAYSDFRDYYTQKGHEGLARDILLARGVDPALMQALCLGKKPLADLGELPLNWSPIESDPSLDAASRAFLLDNPDFVAENQRWAEDLWSSLCVYLPFFPELVDEKIHNWGQMDGPLGRMAGGSTKTPGASEGHGSHSGPHGLDFNPELNWLYAAMSHQGKVAMMNLNVIDWGKVADYEERTGMRVLLFEDESIFDPHAVLYYASELLKPARGNDDLQKQTIAGLDAVHRYCFARNDALLDEQNAPRWADTITPPAGVPEDAFEKIGQHSNAPTVQQPPRNASGWACFLAFAGIEAVHWTDLQFRNEYCTFDTRHLARYDIDFSQGQYSRVNSRQVGDGDAWRCDWLVRYVDVVKEVDLSVRRQILPPGAPHNFAGQRDPSTPFLDALPGNLAGTEWMQTKLTVKIGPHDLGYNAGDGHVYATHYWTMDEPDIRMLPDWTIHAIPQNPMLPDTFVNPYVTVDGPPRRLPDNSRAGSDRIIPPEGAMKVIDVGGPLDGLHPVTLDVNSGTGGIAVANRESNTVSRVSPGQEAPLGGHGITVANNPLDEQSMIVPRSFEVYRTDGSPQHPVTKHYPGPLPQDKCEAFSPPAPGRTSGFRARELCEKGIFRHTGILPASELEDSVRRDARAQAMTLVTSRTPWPAATQTLSLLLESPDSSTEASLDAFRAQYYPRLTSDEDISFLEAAIADVRDREGADRATALAAFRARAEGHLPGLLDAFLDDVVEAVRLPDVAELDDVVTEWKDEAASGALLGASDARVAVGRLESFVRTLRYTTVMKQEAWLQYCVSYSMNELIVLSVTNPEEPQMWMRSGGMAQKGPSGEYDPKDPISEVDPYHCDDVDPPREVWPTPIQTDSSFGGATIIREPPGAAYIDWWHELRPRFFQPFDVWFQPGNDHIYVGNLGNHDNDPLQAGWITQIAKNTRKLLLLYNELEPAANALPAIPGSPWEQMDGNGPCFAPIEDVLCAVAKEPLDREQIDPELEADRLISAGKLPHHFNVNAYTNEIYVGHLSHDGEPAGGVLVSQDDDRSSWTIPKQKIASGPDNPVDAPTGMAVNPASRRLFFTRFLAGGGAGGHGDEHGAHDTYTASPDDRSRLVGIVDLRNHTVSPLNLYGGDHHAAIDVSRTPLGTTEDPFYNRTRELAVGDRRMAGSVLAVGDTSNTLSFFWRCTYYSLMLDVSTSRLITGLDARDPLAGVGATLREPWKLAGSNAFDFDAGRCFNFVDLNERSIKNLQVRVADPSVVPPIEVSPATGLRAYPQIMDPGATTQLWWEVGSERLTYGVVHLFLDPDNVPPGLRISRPGAGVTGRVVGVDAHATEELASAYAEIDAQSPTVVPRGDLLFTAASPLDHEARWALEFDTRYHVEAAGPDPRLEMFVHAGDAAMPDELSWRRSSAVEGPRWHEWPVALPMPEGETLRVAFTLDVQDAPQTARRSWTIAGLRLERPLPAEPPRPGHFDTLELPLDTLAVEPSGAFARTLVADPTGRTEDPVPAYWFVDERNIVAEGGFAFEIPAAEVIPGTRLIVTTRSDVRLDSRSLAKPYDVMTVDWSVDNGLTWRTVWRRDNRDAPAFDPIPVRVDVTPLAAKGAPPPLVRARFDAVDPAHNGYPGWEIGAVRLVRHSPGAEVRLEPPASLAAAGEIPTWVDITPEGESVRTFHFTTLRGDYAAPTSGLTCRLDSPGLGAWSTGDFVRHAGSGRLTVCGRDLAGNEVHVLVRDGLGRALVEDDFTSPGFTESYWQREEDDPHGIGFAAYVADGVAGGGAEDNVAKLVTELMLVPAAPGPGENFLASRAFLIDGGSPEAELPDGTPSVTTGSPRRRAFVATPGDPDIERLPKGLQAVVEQEQGFLNASHVKQLEPVEPRDPTDAIRPARDQEGMMGGCLEVYGCDVFAFGALRPPQQWKFSEVVEPLRNRAQAALWPPDVKGVRTHLPLDTYVLEAVPTLRPQAAERLSHRFHFDGQAAAPQAVELDFDVTTRTYGHAFTVDVTPELPLPDLADLRSFVETVRLSEMVITEEEFASLVGDEKAAEVVFGAPETMAKTLSDFDVTAETFWSFVAAGIDLLLGDEDIEVSVTGILNDLGLLGFNLPVYGGGFAVDVKLVPPEGPPVTLASRDGIGSEPLGMHPAPLDPNTRVTLATGEAPGTYVARVSEELGRVERIRVRLDAAEAAQVLGQTGDYRLVIEARTLAPISPAPGLVQEITYGPLALRAELAPVANLAPDAGFSWWGPVAPRTPVAFYPARASPVLGGLEDLDGHVARYEWRFHGVDAARVTLDGQTLVPDADPSLADDRNTNAVATRHGLRASRLTLTTADGVTTLAYGAAGCAVPIPSVAFPAAGRYAVELTVTDDDGATSTTSHVVQITQRALDRRAPEFLVDPVDSGPGEVAVAWQQNHGSLFLDASGRSRNLTSLIPNFDPSTLSELNPQTLVERIQFEGSGLTPQDITGAIHDSSELAQSLGEGALDGLTLLLDWLLVRPGISQVVTSVPEPAAGGVRFTTLTGSLPAAEPKLGNRGVVPGLFGGLADRRTPEDLALPDFAPGRECDALSVNRASVSGCDPAIQDILRLLRKGLGSFWSFRYALHPSTAEGVADLDETIVSFDAIDAGFGPIMLVQSATESVLHGAGAALAGLDPMGAPASIPIDDLNALARNLDASSRSASAISTAVGALHEFAQSPTLAGETVEDREHAIRTAAGVLGIDQRGLEDEVSGAATLRSEAITAFAEFRAALDAAEVAAEQQFAAADADLAFWESTLTGGVGVAALRERLALGHARALSAIDAQREEAYAREAAAIDAIDALDLAYTTIYEWAEDWPAAIEAGEPIVLATLLEDAAVALEQEAGALTTFAIEAAARILKLLEDLLAILTGATRVAFPANEPLTLGYDADTGRAFVRVGDAIALDTVVETRPSAVHASLTLAAIVPSRLEIQALWAGRGAKLIDGFNRNGAVDPARFDVRLPGASGTTASASTALVAPAEESSTHQVLWVARSPEERPPPDEAPERRDLRSMDEQSSRLNGFSLTPKDRALRGVDEHRSLHDGRASPPWYFAAHVPDTVLRTDATVVDESEASAAIASVLDEPRYHSAVVGGVAPGAWQEFRVADADWQPRSAPAKHLRAGSPSAPYVFDVHSIRLPGEPERLQIAFQPAGAANPPIVRYEIYASPRPREDATVDDGIRVHLGDVVPGEAIGVGRPFPYHSLTLPAVPAALAGEWRYVSVRAVNTAGEKGPFSYPVLVPPVHLEERFATAHEGPLQRVGAAVSQGDGTVEIEIGGVPLVLEGDPCLGDRVAITRETSYPHDAIAAPWGRALVVEERGYDTLLALLRTLGQPLASVPVDLRVLDGPIPENIDLCPTLESLLRDIHAITGDLRSGLVGYEHSLLDALHANQPQVDPESDPVLKATRDGRAVEAWAQLSRRLLGDRDLHLELGELLHATPAAVTWQTEPVDGAWAARARVQIPSKATTPYLTAKSSLDALLPDLRVLGLGAIVPTERAHALQVGHVAADGSFTPIASVDVDPLDLQERLIALRESTNNRVQANLAITGMTNVVAGIFNATDGRTGHSKVGTARFDRWHTIELFGSGDSGIYTASVDGQAIGEFRLASPLRPNAIRLGGTALPSTLVFDDLRLGPALHPAVPLVRISPYWINEDSTRVSWYVPETGGAPLTDFTLIRRDLARPGSPAEVVATAGAGSVRLIEDPTSHEGALGRHLAYSVQAQNALRPQSPGDRAHVGQASDARATRPPSVLRIQDDTSISHAHGTDLVDDETYDGMAGLAVGTSLTTVWRSLLAIDLTQVIDVAGEPLDLRRLAGADLLLRSVATRPGAQRPFIEPEGLDEHNVPGAFERSRVDGALPFGNSMSGRVPADCRNALLVATPTEHDDPLVTSGSLARCADSDIRKGPRCIDVTREDDPTWLPFNCHEDAIGAHVVPGSWLDPTNATWNSQPRDNFEHVSDGIDRQMTSGLTWRRYDLLAALQRLGAAEFGVILKKEVERADSPHAVYASREAAAWLDERPGLDGEGPRAVSPFLAGTKVAELPWTREHASSGAHSLRIGGRSGYAAVDIPLADAVEIGPGVPLRMDVLIPDGSSPRQLGLYMRAVATTRVPGGCHGAPFGQEFDVVATWGRERTIFRNLQTPQIDADGELGAYGDLATAPERQLTFHAGGVPPMRGRWTTLSFDMEQALAESGARRMREPLADPEGLFLFDSARPLGDDTLDWRLHPFRAGHRVGICTAEIVKVSLFVVDGEMFVDRLGPDVGPRVRLQLGGGLP